MKLYLRLLAQRRTIVDRDGEYSMRCRPLVVDRLRNLLDTIVNLIRMFWIEIPSKFC